MKPRFIPARRRALTSMTSLALLPVIGLQSAAAEVLVPGVFVGNDPAETHRFEQWLGRQVPQVMVFTDLRSWRGIADPGWFVERFASIERPALWSIPMVPEGEPLASAAAGQHTEDYRSAATKLLAARRHPDGTIRIRIGWEFNGDWFAWAAEGHEADFVAVFRDMVSAFRSVSPDFRFEWNMNYGQRMDPMLAFPGAEFVDVLGMDFYWSAQYLGNDPVVAFERIRDDRYGLRYLDDMAARFAKPIAFSEWGVTGNDAAPFVERVGKWMADRNVVYHDYWDSDAAYPGLLSDGKRWPSTSAAFRRTFGAAASTPKPRTP